MPSLSSLAALWKSKPDAGVRVVAFGSSNTELLWHSGGCHNWACWLQCCLREWVGRHVSLTNVGICGETTEELLGRIDRDVFPLSPTAVILTIGGNDQARVALDRYRANLEKLIELLKAQNIEIVFQTYYGVMLKDAALTHFETYMDTMKEVACQSDVPVIDIYAWMSAWWKAEPEAYRSVMLDDMHVNPLGNALMGTLGARAFGLPDPVWPDTLAKTIPAMIEQMERYADLPPAIC